MIDETWFFADEWNLPDMHFQEFPWNSEIDHEWHEFDCLEETTEQSIENKSIEDFLNLIQGKRLNRIPEPFASLWAGYCNNC